ncbi:Hsp20 family protein [Cytobacillus sp. Hm23]
MIDFDQFKNLNNLKDQWGHFFGKDFLSGFDSIFNGFQSQAPVNIYQSHNELLVVVSMPGLDKESDVDLYVNKNNQTLEVKGNINLAFKGFDLQEQGIQEGTVEKNIELPFPVIDDRIDASYHNGLLIIHLHKLISKDAKKKIKVHKIED